MKILIAPDSFKENLTALQVANAIEEGFSKIYPHAEYMKIPMSDGGEGTVCSLIDDTQGTLIKAEVLDPLGHLTQASFGLSGDGKTAIIEMAAASGLALIPAEKRSPLKTTSYGTGQLIKAALDHQVKKIILGLGGSATNDAGVGMLQALGGIFLDKQQKQISFGGLALSGLTEIDTTRLDPRLKNVEIDVACDVINPLCGKQGASKIFAPQKGATPDMVNRLDLALSHFARIVEQQCGKKIADIPGSGAAGGMGAGLQLLPNVVLKSGVQIVIEYTNLAYYLEKADLVITGEGCMDSQSIKGKTPIGVASVAKQFNKPVIAIVGSIRPDYESVYQYGIDAVFPIIRQASTLQEALNAGKANLISTAQNIARLWLISNLKT